MTFSDETSSEADHPSDPNFELPDIFSNKPVTSVSSKTYKGKYSCSVDNCNQVFKRQTYLDKHEYSHTGIKKHKCDYPNCDKSYVISTHLKRHKQIFHEGVRAPKELQCPINGCGKNFDSPFNVDRHIKEVHEDPKLYKCSECSKEFRRKDHLKRHQINHSKDAPKKCATCSKGFIYENDLLRHKCKIKKYECNECNLEFQNWSSLISHRRENHVVKYKCEKCGKSFNRNWNLRKHIAIHEENDKREVIRCPYENCTKYYFHEKNLNVHIRTKHQGEQFKCPIMECGRILSTKSKLNYHVRLHEIDPGRLKSVRKNTNELKTSKTKTQMKSYAAKLAAVMIEPSVDNLILKGDSSKVDIHVDHLSEVTDTEDERSAAKNMKIVTLCEKQ